jgi:hypothetical protein
MILKSKILLNLSGAATNCENALSNAQEYINDFIDYYKKEVGDDHDDYLGDMLEEAFRVRGEISGALEGAEGLASDCSEIAWKREE